MPWSLAIARTASAFARHQCHDFDGGPASCIGDGFGYLCAEIRQVSGCSWFTVPDNRRDTGTQGPGCHGVPHRAGAKKRNRLFSLSHCFSSLDVSLLCKPQDPPSRSLLANQGRRTIFPRVWRCSNSAKASATRSKGYVAAIGISIAPEAARSAISVRTSRVEAVPLPSALTPSSWAFSKDAIVSIRSRGIPRSTASSRYWGPNRSMKASILPLANVLVGAQQAHHRRKREWSHASEASRRSPRRRYRVRLDTREAKELDHGNRPNPTRPPRRDGAWSPLFGIDGAHSRIGGTANDVEGPGNLPAEL